MTTNVILSYLISLDPIWFIAKLHYRSKRNTVWYNKVKSDVYSEYFKVNILHFIRDIDKLVSFYKVPNKFMFSLCV